jgi:ribosomal protein S7
MLEKQHQVLTRLIQMLIKKGKKAKALKIVLMILRKLREKQFKNFDAYLIINKAIKYLKPLLYVQKVRKGRKVFYLPKVIKIEKKISVCLY